MTVPEDKGAAAAQGMLHAWWAARIPDRLALVSPQGDRTYADLNAEINRLSRALRARGLQPGDAIALMCTNRPEFVEVLYAAQRTGLRLTPINWHLTGEEAAYIVENCEAKAFVCSGELGDKVAVAAEAGGPGLVKINTGGYLPGFEMYNTVVADEEGSDIDDPVIGTQMLYTSGTTGRPKGVHRETAAVSTLALVNFCGYDEDYETSVDAHLLTGPLYHAAPLAFSVAVPLVYGVPLVLMDHWDPVEALRLIERHGITHTHMVPTMFHRLMALPAEERERFDTSSLRFVIHGAAPCPVPVKQRLIEWLGPVVVEYYAATEGLGTLVDSATWLAHPGTVGRPMIPGLVKVADDEGNDLPPGEVGLVFLQAPAATKFDYYGDTEKTAGAFRGRLLHARRHGLHGRRGIPLPDRPHRQPHHLGRREHLPGRGRRRAPGAPGGGRRRHHRRARRGMGRGGEGRRAAGRRGQRQRRAGGGAHGVLPGAPGPFQVSPQRRLRR